MEKNNDIEISILKADKLFNENTPFVINLSSPEPDEDIKKSNADLICVIDISCSMSGEKIWHVKESLKILLNLMDEKDRICLILFDNDATNYFNLNYLTKKNKEILNQKIDKIDSRGGTNIMSGLQLAVEVIKNQCNKQNSASSVLLLSDGCDNYLNDIEIAESLKKLTKGLGLSFTLNTFGYGDDHDPKIMNKLANLRDGSFFYVEDYSKITEYFVAILGGCVSVISKKVDLNLTILNNNCQISRILGEDNLYDYQSNSKSFKTSILQFICGKDYTFVLEIFVNNSKVQIEEELFKVEINYEDITQNNKRVKKEKKYNYHLKELDYSKANDEYIRAYVYYTLNKAIKLKDQNQMKEGKKILENLEKWLLNNYKGSNKDYIKDVGNAKGLFSDDDYTRMRSYKISNEIVNEKLFKNAGKTKSNYNKTQFLMLKSISHTTPIVNNYYSNYTKIPLKLGKYFNENRLNNNESKDKQNIFNKGLRKIRIKPLIKEPKDNMNNTSYNRRNIIKYTINIEKKDIMNNTSYNINNKRNILSKNINIEQKDNMNKEIYKRKKIILKTNK